MRKLKIFCIVLLMCLISFCGCGSSDNDELQKQMEELQKQNEELITRLEQMEQTADTTVMPTLSPTPTVEPTEILTPTILPTSTPEPTVISTPIPEPTATPTLSPSPTPTSTPTPTLTPTATLKPTNTPTPVVKENLDISKLIGCWRSDSASGNYRIFIIEENWASNTLYNSSGNILDERSGSMKITEDGWIIIAYRNDSSGSWYHPISITENSFIDGALEHHYYRITSYESTELNGDSDVKPTSTPKPTETQNNKIWNSLDKLKEAIIKNGKYEDGCSVVVHTIGQMVARIDYLHDEDIFMFTNMLSDDTWTAVLQFKWGKTIDENTTVYLMHLDDLMDCDFVAQANLDGTKYNGEKLTFEVVSDLSGGDASLFEMDYAEPVNNQLKLAMIVFDEYILPMYDLNLVDIGFKLFNLSLENSTTSNTNTQPTTSQQQAVKMAKSYLGSIAFSRTGLIEQLEYEGFSKSDATYGVDNCGANWYEQAAKCARSYLNSMAFSRSGLIDQLEYEGFTYDQAVYGVEQNGL